MVGLGSLSLSLFNTGSTSSISSFDYSALATPAYEAPPQAPNPRKLTPWDSHVAPPATDKLAREAMTSTRLVNPGFTTGAGSDVTDKNDRTLFVVHNALTSLGALAIKMTSKGLSDAERQRYQARIDKGLKEIREYAGSVKLDGALMLPGKRLATHLSAAMPRVTGTHQMKPVFTGELDEVNGAFQGDKRFSMTVEKNGVPQTINFDLAEMGATPRTMTAVSGYMNSKLEAAGVETRLSRTETKLPALYKGGLERKSQQFELNIGYGETVGFKPADAAAPALTVAGQVRGAKTTDPVGFSVIEKAELAGTGSKEVFETDATPAVGSVQVRAMTKDADGNSFVIADLSGQLDGVSPRAKDDVVLRKLDSTGAVVWTRPLGAFADVQGASIAVSDDGHIAIAGQINGKIDNSASVTGNGVDSFVAVFDNEGRDSWQFQQGGVRTDTASQVAFDDAGNVYMAGQFSESLASATTQGGTDAYVQSFDTTGALRWTRSMGTVADDAVGGLLVENGKVSVAVNNASGATLYDISQTDGTNNSTARDLSADGLARVSFLMSDDAGGVLLAGSDTAKGVTDKVKLMTGGTVTKSLNLAGESIRALDVHNGVVAVALGAGKDNDGKVDYTKSVVKGLSLADGSEQFKLEIKADARDPIALDYSASYDSTLSQMGLPTGTLRFGDTDKLADLTAIRTGDSFAIAVNGGREKKITIAADETLRSLAKKINKVLLRDGTAEARLGSGNQTLAIKPNAGDRIELIAGKGMADALKALGLEAGVALPRALSSTAKKSVTDPPPVVSLDLPETADVSTADKAKTFSAAIDTALRHIRIGYREISSDPTMVALREQNAAAANKKGSTSKTSAAAVAAYQKQAQIGMDALSRMGVSF